MAAPFIAPHLQRVGQRIFKNEANPIVRRLDHREKGFRHFIFGLKLPKLNGHHQNAAKPATNLGMLCIILCGVKEMASDQNLSADITSILKQQNSEMLRLLKQAYRFASHIHQYPDRSLHSKSFEDWLSGCSEIINSCGEMTNTDQAPADNYSESARQLMVQLRAATADPRCGHIMAVGIASTMLERLRPETWTAADRALLLSAFPGGDEDEYLKVLERSTKFEELSDYASLFYHLENLPSAGLAAIFYVILHNDLIRDGKISEANKLDKEIRSRARGKRVA